MAQFKRFNTSENDNYDSSAVYPEGTLTWDPSNGLRIHDGGTSGGNAVGSSNFYDLTNRPTGNTAVHDLQGGSSSEYNGYFLKQTSTGVSEWSALPTTYDTLTIDTKIIGGIDGAAGTQITGIEATLGYGVPYRYAFISGNDAFGNLFNRGSAIIGWKMYPANDPSAFVTITEFLNNDLGAPSLGFDGSLAEGPWIAESSDYSAGANGPLTLSADTKNWVLGTGGVMTLPSSGEIADSGVAGVGTKITVPLNAANDTEDYVGGASVIEVPTNGDTTMVQPGWIITFPGGTQRTVSSSGQAGGYTSIYYNDSNPGLGSSTYPLTIQSADYVEYVPGSITLNKGDSTWIFDDTGKLIFPGTLSIPAAGTVSGTNESGNPGLNGTQTFNAALSANPGLDSVQPGWTVTGNNLTGTTLVTSVVEVSAGLYEITTDTIAENPFWYNDVYTFTGTGTMSWSFSSDGFTSPRTSETDPILTINGGANPGITSIHYSLEGPANFDIDAHNTIFTGYEGTSVTIYPDNGAIMGDVNLVLTSNNTDPDNTHSWTFSSDGNLTLPGNTFAVKYANGTQVSLGGGGTTLPADASGYLNNNGSGTLTWVAGNPTGSGMLPYNGVTVLSNTTTADWTEYTLSGTMDAFYDWNNNYTTITLSSQTAYGKEINVNTKNLWINDSKINSNDYLVIAFPSTPSVGDVFTVPIVNTLTTVNAGSFVVGETYTISSVGTTNWTSIGAVYAGAGQSFVATGAGSGTGTATTTAGAKKVIFKPASGHRAQSMAQGQLGPVVFGQGGTYDFMYVDLGGQNAGNPLTWVYAGVIDSIPSWYQFYF